MPTKRRPRPRSGRPPAASRNSEGPIDASRPWLADRVVEPDLAVNLIETQFPVLGPVSACQIGAGWDNTVFLINDALVFRFPRREIAVPLVRTEMRLLPWLSSWLPLNVPAPAFVGRPSMTFPWPFVGYPMLPGRPVQEARLGDEQRRSLAVPLAGFLRALHAIPADAALERGAAFDTLDRLNVERRSTATKERLERLITAGAVQDAGPIEAILAAAPVVDAPRSDALVHGDLHAGQFLVDEEGRLSGVIDWGDVHVGDPAVDLAAVHAMLPVEAHETFLRAYGPVDERSWAAARARATWHTVALLAHAWDSRNADMTQEATRALARLTSAGHGTVAPGSLLE